MKSSKVITVFLDRDGTINVNLPFPNVNRPEKLSLLPGAADGIKTLKESGCRVFVVTNQAGINNPENDLDWETFHAITDGLSILLGDDGCNMIDDTFVCPHQRNENCNCRKPNTGLYEQAKERYGDFELEETYVVGDRSDDIIAGKRIGARTILVLTGHGRETERDLDKSELKPDHVAEDLNEAARIIAENKAS